MPPPVHGAAVMGQAAAQSAVLRELFDVTVIPIRINSGLASLQRFSLAKVWASLRLWLAVVRALVVRRPSAVYFTVNIAGFAFWRDLAIVLTCRLAGVRRVFHLHMKGLRGNYQRSRAMRAAYRLMFAGADVVHLSQRLYRDVEPVVPRDRFHVVHNGIDVEVDRAGRAPEQADVPEVLFLSNLYASKGPLDLLEASRRVAALGIAHKLVFAGAGPEADVVRRIKASGHAQWVGAVDGEAKRALLRSADVFVFPSYYHFECQPLAVIEAMAWGKAVIASDEAAIPDLIADGVDGILVRARAIDELTGALAMLLTHPGLRAKLGVAARARYEEEFTRAKFERRLADTLWRIAVPQPEQAFAWRQAG